MSEKAGRPFSDLRAVGLLWLINTALLHPRGYALALHSDDEGNATGWSLLGDGSEPWYFDPSEPSDREFLAVNDLLMPKEART